VIRNRPLRRTLALVLIVGGALAMWLAASSPAGIVAFAVGVLLELVGIALERRGPR